MLKTAVRRVMPIPMYLRRRPLEPQMDAAQLDDYLQALTERAQLDGAVLEVGCFRGATTVVACQTLRDLGAKKRYVCVDTFAGFVEEQFVTDVEHGTPESFRTGFAENPREMFDRTMRHFGFPVESIEADICTLDPERLPATVSVCLMDVDLAVPIREGLELVLPRMVPGGIMLVDDCDAGTSWRGARVGYQEFVAAHGLPERYTDSGFGIVTT